MFQDMVIVQSVYIGKLYAIGGDGVDSVEVYDPDNNTWTLLQHKLDGKVAGAGAGLIKKYYVNK